jgi:DNA-binding NarL/FixJ family response regulator
MASRETPRLAIADANPLVMAALRELFEREGRFKVVHICTGGAALVSALLQSRCDVAVAGWRLSDMTAADLLGRLKSGAPATRVTVLSSDHDPTILRRCVKLGAMGFCWQSDAPSVLIETVEAVHHNRMSLPYIDVSKMDDTPLSALTPRERDLLKALSDGWNNLQIASRFGVSQNTVKYHLKNVYDKLGVKNRAMAITLFVSENRRG